MANKTVTVKQTGGTYDSLSAALAGEKIANPDLTATGMNGILTIECYAMNDTTQANISTGWTTDATHYINITCPAGERHSGVWDGTKYNISVTNAYALLNSIAYTRVSFLQLKTTKSASAYYHVLRNTNAGDYSWFFNNIIYGLGAYTGAGIHLENNIGCYVFNNLSYSDSYVNANASNHGIGGETDAGANYFYNNTSIGWAYGYQAYNTNQSIYKNNISYGSHNAAWLGTPWTGSDYNATDRDAATGNTNDRVSQTFSFVDANNQNYHLLSTDEGAKGFGVDLSSAFTTDIDGETRPAVWDIGMDQAELWFGWPTKGPTGTYWDACLFATKFTLPVEGTITSIYLAVVQASGTQYATCALYTSGGSLLSATSEITVTGAYDGWIELPLLTPQTVSAGTYMLANMESATALKAYYSNAGTAGQQGYIWRTYADGIPSSASFSFNYANKYSIYAEYYLDINGSSAIVKTNNWNKILEAYLVDGGVVKNVEEAYITVNGEWKKWWPPPP